MPDDDYRFTIRNELDQVYVVTQTAWPHLAAGGGAVITTASLIAHVAMTLPPGGGWSHAATKGAIVAMNREWAKEGGPFGIRFNVISPGMIVVPSVAAILGPETTEQFLEKQIIKRLGQPEDIALTAVFLASDESAFITGQEIIVDGGYVAI